ncbi:DcaP family trimeric outer membrane transporter [Vibrio maritimus]|uniref:DcaP family trimeric outer membrane transporter n=1 Tax=Vibrio maritimus TaxID=990268 RepID=UPI001F280C26|nr:DcaP family trimeric outer membrane transporter [Vibrio maritimus]
MSKVMPPYLAFLAALLPSTSNAIELTDKTKMEVSGKVVGAVIADSNVSGIGSNNLANAFYGKNEEPSIAIDTTLTKINFGTQTELDNDELLNSFISVDFNNSNNNKMDLRLREAYVDWRMGNSSLLVGQTWSTLMDINRLPDSVLEPTISGVVFTRQPMVRWSQNFGSFRYDIALESGSNRVQVEDPDVSIDNSSTYPDLVIGLQTNTDGYWFRAAGVVNRVTTTDLGQSETYSDTGWAAHLSGGIKLSDKDHFQMAYFNSRGNDRYVLGIGQTGPIYDEQNGQFHIRDSQSLWTAIGHSWTDTLKSTFGYGRWQADPYDGQGDTFTSTEMGLANLKWTARENLVLGLEYNYTTYERSYSESRDNHRLILAMEYDF